VKQRKSIFVQQNEPIMDQQILEAFVIQAFESGMAGRNGTTTTVVDVTSENTGSAETQVVPTPKPKRYRVPKNEDCIRLVEEHTKKLTEDDDGSCMLCCENKVEVELIHSVCKGGDGKEHHCLNNRFCKSCITQSIAAQETRQSVIIPQCPCCRGRVSKMVQLDNNVVLDLPPFKPESYGVILKNARLHRLVFSYNGTGITEGSTGTINVSKWELLAPSSVEADKAKVATYTRTKASWSEIWNATMFSMMNMDVIGWPDQKMLLRAINIKLKEMNRSDFRWLPKVYGGTLHTPTDLGIIRKRQRETASVSSDGSGAGSSSSSSSRTPRVACNCPACTQERERKRTCDCDGCVHRRAREAAKAKKKRKKKRKKTSSTTE